jgi:cytochrome c553|tara:strand:+ start:329 stop:526 length:198 start_codon:yes stop_codon:yes gene_type:complete
MCFGGKSAQTIYEETKPPTPPLPSLSMDSVEYQPSQYKDVKKPEKRKGMTQRTSLLSNQTTPMGY